MGLLAGKVAIITGGSGGIGSAICDRLAQDGAKIVVHYGGHADEAEKIVAKIKENGGEAVAIQANLSKVADVSKLFDETQASFGSPDIVVNNAGTGVAGAIAETDEESFDKVFNLNAKRTFFCMKEAAQRMNNNGRIVNISSGLVVSPMAGFSLYIASKAAVELMGKVLSMELGDRNITVNTVSLGPTQTDMFASSEGRSPSCRRAIAFQSYRYARRYCRCRCLCCQRTMSLDYRTYFSSWWWIRLSFLQNLYRVAFRLEKP